MLKKYLGISLIVMLFILAGLLTPLFLPKVYSQNPNCINVTPRVNNGIFTTPNLQSGSKFGTRTNITNGQCIIDPIQAGIVSFKIPTYDDLKNTYFQRKAGTASILDKQTRTGSQFGLDFTGPDFAGGSCTANCSRLWNINGDLAIGNQAAINLQAGPVYQNAIIFVEGDLNIGDLNTSFTNSSADVDLRYGNNNTGIVYIVRGNVNFGRNIRIFDGIIIAQGDPTCISGPSACYSICTSFDGNCAPDTHQSSDNGGETKQLTINGNLISLDSAHPIRFQRNLLLSTCGGTCPNGNDTTPAEVINVQPKYLVVLRNLLSETLSIQTEDTRYAVNQ